MHASGALTYVAKTVSVGVARSTGSVGLKAASNLIWSWMPRCRVISSTVPASTVQAASVGVPLVFDFVLLLWGACFLRAPLAAEEPPPASLTLLAPLAASLAEVPMFRDSEVTHSSRASAGAVLWRCQRRSFFIMPWPLEGPYSLRIVQPFGRMPLGRQALLLLSSVQQVRVSADVFVHSFAANGVRPAVMPVLVDEIYQGSGAR
jgi:hypothetical protein